MARTIPRRKSPPYLLIIMVFLFLTSTGLAVKMHMDREKAVKEAAQAKKIMAVVVNKENLKLAVAQYVDGQDVTQEANVDDKGYSVEDLCQLWREKADSATARGTDATVVSWQHANLLDLVQYIVGKDASYREARKMVEQLRAEIKAEDPRKTMSGLVSEIRTLRAIVVKLQGKNGEGGTIGVLKKARTAEEDKVRDMGEKLKDLAATHRDQTNALGKQIADQAEKFRGELATMSDNLKAERSEHTEKRDLLHAEVQKKTTEADKLKMDLRTIETKVSMRDTQIAQLKDRINILERRKTAETRLVKKISSDGGVMSDPDRQGYCYINIGANDGVRRNWTFAVYPQGPITEETKAKGAIVVTRVLPDVSECRLTKDVGGEVAAIAKGDLIANLAFDKSRTYTFVIEGIFDLHGTGRATLAGGTAVKALIRNYGGKVVDKVVVNTDYVVLGQELPKPVEPSQDAPPQVRKAYEDNLKIWQRYNDVKKKAIELRIPVLNSNRFLDYIGQMPEKRLEYSD